MPDALAFVSLPPDPGSPKQMQLELECCIWMQKNESSQKAPNLPALERGDFITYTLSSILQYLEKPNFVFF